MATGESHEVYAGFENSDAEYARASEAISSVTSELLGQGIAPEVIAYQLEEAAKSLRNFS